MNVSGIPGYHDPLGLFWYVAWLTGRSFWSTWLVLCVLTLGVTMVLARLAESRPLPLRPKHQFVGFFPGVILLGMTAAWLLHLAQDLPYDARWYNSGWFNALVQLVTLAFAIKATRDELKQKIYPKRAVFSPTKLYVNFALYAGYGYLITVTLFAVIFGSAWSFGFFVQLVLALIPGLVWAKLVARENTLGEDDLSDKLQIKAAHAHVADWRPIWRRKKADPEPADAA